MRTDKAKRYDNQKEREIDKAIANFPHHLMSNAKWVKLIGVLSNNEQIKKIQFKRVLGDEIGELFFEDATFEFDYWENGFEGMNSLKGWLLYKEIEYILFPFESDKGTQNLQEIKSIIEKVGTFELIENRTELILVCYQ